jgi:hypothetical protein
MIPDATSPFSCLQSTYGESNIVQEKNIFLVAFIIQFGAEKIITGL